MKTQCVTTILALLGTIFGANAQVIETVEYPSADRTHRSFLAHSPDVATKRPAVLILPEWWGLNLHARTVAHDMADLGYVALAVDMYGDGQLAENPDQATALVTEVLTTPGAVHERFEAALEFLKKQPGVDPERIVVIGYCFGGRVALENARRGLKVAGIFTLHGILDSDETAKPGTIRSPIHVFNGAADPMVNDETVLKFTREMLTAGAPFTITSYPGAQHSFTKPEATVVGKKFKMPLAYDPEAAQDSRRTIDAFLSQLRK